MTFKIGSRNGSFVLKERRHNRDGTFTDKWVFDPVVKLLPIPPTCRAYSFVSSNSTIEISNPDVATSEFPSADYEYVQSDDGTYVVRNASASTVGRYANIAKRFVFDLAQYVGLGITEIKYRWDGYFTCTLDLRLNRAMHKETGGWVTDVSTLPTADGPGWEVQVTLTNISQIVIDGLFTFGLVLTARVLETSGSIYLYTDAVELEVTYTVLTDSGSGAESASVALIAVDSGSGAELALASLTHTSGDVGVGYESAIIPFSVSDEGVGHDVSILQFKSIFIEDKGLGLGYAEISDITFKERVEALMRSASMLMDFIIKMMPIMMIGALVKSVSMLTRWKPAKLLKVKKAERKAAVKRK